jgi:hypothetical protein
VPAQHGFGFYDEQRGSPADEPPVRQAPETPVRIREAGPRLAALQDQQLLAQTKIVCDQQHPWPHGGSNGPQ